MSDNACPYPALHQDYIAHPTQIMLLYHAIGMQSTFLLSHAFCTCNADNAFEIKISDLVCTCIYIWTIHLAFSHTGTVILLMWETLPVSSTNINAFTNLQNKKHGHEGHVCRECGNSTFEICMCGHYANLFSASIYLTIHAFLTAIKTYLVLN